MANLTRFVLLVVAVGVFVASFASLSTAHPASELNIFPFTILSVTPGLVSVNQRYTNLSISVLSLPKDLDCVRCSFNGTQGNVSTAGELFPGSLVYCMFDNLEVDVNSNEVVEVWLQRCDSNKQLTTNTWPLYTYDEVPSILSVLPSPIIATGGTQLTIDLSSPFDALRVSSKYRHNVVHPTHESLIRSALVNQSTKQKPSSWDARSLQRFTERPFLTGTHTPRTRTRSSSVSPSLIPSVNAIHRNQHSDECWFNSYTITTRLWILESLLVCERGWPEPQGEHLVSGRYQQQHHHFYGSFNCLRLR